ncbi:hypothetical protein CFK38_14955 [Brachybacterium vulturis]|uniref:Uncharacterized protein n=1 Tax=Brachybacterium vulturis TaxID=2017484 RepID=A0A291GQP6_9MICO|nr:hypothetical protein [Brachybacterium vulturis]ATG52679.1 hypothetical protein CFK38_14955 [Brachybacterium vulturis]
MADWKTYAKAARNTARKQAPGAKDAARRASGQASAYVRAAGKAIDEGHRPDGAPSGPTRDGDGPRERGGPRRDAEGAPRATGARSSSSPSGAATAARPAVDKERLRQDAAAYYTVASRRVASVNIVPRVMRALRDALLIGLSLLIIWGVLFAAGIPIPFTTVLIIVGLIVVVSFAGGLYAQWKRSREVLDATEDPRDR